MPVTPTEFVIEHAPWSISKLNLAAQCPHAFHQKYVVGRKMGFPLSSDALVGNAVHTLLEFLMKGHPLKAAHRAAVNKYGLTTMEIERVVAFHPAITSFQKRMAAYFNRCRAEKPVLEQQYAIDFEGNSVGYWSKKGFLRGAIDLSVQFQGKPYALILDHKSGKAKPLEQYEWQFASYKLLFRAHHPDVQKVQLCINHLFTESVDMVKGMHDVRDVSAMLDTFMDYANRQTRSSYNHRVTRKSPLCGWCDYQSICPAHGNYDGNKTKQR